MGNNKLQAHYLNEDSEPFKYKVGDVLIAKKGIDTSIDMTISFTLIRINSTRDWYYYDVLDKKSGRFINNSNNSAINYIHHFYTLATPAALILYGVKT